MRNTAPMASCLALVASAVLLGGCASDRDFGFFGGGPDSVRYRCDDDRSMRVSYSDDRERASVDAGGSVYRLRLTDRDGNRRTYGGGDVRLIVDGDEARLRVADGRDYSGCEES